MKITYPKGHQEFHADIKYSTDEPDRGNRIQGLSPAVHTNQLVPCTDPPHSQDLDLNEYQLHLLTPAGWCQKKHRSRISFTPTHPAIKAQISLSWYQPNREASYQDFDRRIDNEVSGESSESQNIRRFTLGHLKAVEHTSSNPFVVATYIRVPVNKQSGDLYMIIFTYFGTDHAEQERYLNVYHELIRSIRISKTSH